MMQYLLASSLAGFVECGFVLMAMNAMPYHPWAWVAAGFAYQIGSYCADRVANRPALILAIDLTCIGTALALAWPLALLGVAASLSYRVHAWRNRVMTPVPTWMKRTARVAGFVAGGLWLFPATAALSWLVAVAITWSEKVTLRQNLVPHRWTPWMTVMLLHQVHYFAYCYLVFGIIGDSFRLPLVVLPACFALGWISYLSVEPLIGHLPDRIILVGGHLLLATTLGMMATSSFSEVSLWLWGVTGFGGGTVYCIGRLSGCERAMVDAEDVGHVFGAFIGLVLSLATGGWTAPVVVASLFAVVVALLSSAMEPNANDKQVQPNSLS